jgi:GGDEF domain-containing protein
MDANSTVELQVLGVTVTAQRAMLRARHPQQVVDALELAVARLGGTTTPGHLRGEDSLHLDIGLGVREPLLPCAAADDPARARLERVLPGLVEDATRTVQRLWRLEEQADPTLVDELTGSLHTAATTRLVTRAASGDALVGWALDVDGAVARTHGPARVDVLLRDLASYVRSELDVDERLGRLHGPGVVAVLPHPAADRAAAVGRRVIERWERRDGRGSAALTHASAVVGSDPVEALTRLRTDLGLQGTGQGAAT